MLRIPRAVMVHAPIQRLGYATLIVGLPSCRKDLWSDEGARSKWSRPLRLVRTG